MNTPDLLFAFLSGNWLSF